MVEPVGFVVWSEDPRNLYPDDAAEGLEAAKVFNIGLLATSQVTLRPVDQTGATIAFKTVFYNSRRSYNMCGRSDYEVY